MKELISVIVPIYKVEKYLDRCIKSITDQTYNDLEIILVDDGSPDSCPAMCDAWAERDGRIKVVHKENGGLSDARNAGIEVATGEFISFVDSDDWLLADFYSVLYAALVSNGCSVAECGFVKTSGDEPGDTGSGVCTVCTAEEAMRLHLEDGMFRQVVWNKLYRRSVVTAEFDRGKYHEDVFWTYKIIANCERLVHVDMPLYCYFQRENSIMGNAYSKKRLDAIEASALRADFVAERYPALADCARDTLLGSCTYHGQLVLKYLRSDDRKSALGYLKETYNKYPLSGEYEKKLTKKQRAWLALSRISFALACRVRNLLGIGV